MLENRVNEEGMYLTHRNNAHERNGTEIKRFLKDDTRGIISRVHLEVRAITVNHCHC